MNQQIAPQRPVRLWEHVDRVPRAALQSRATLRQRNQPKLALGAVQETVEMRRWNVPIGAELEHRRRLLGYVEGQTARLVPHGDQLDKRASREFTVARRTHALADDPSSLGTSDAPAEVPRPFRRQTGKAHDMPPDDLGRSVDFDAAQYDAFTRMD